MNGDLTGTHILLADAGWAERVVREDMAARQRLLNDPRADMLRGERGDHPRGYRIEGGAALVPIVGALIPRGPVGMAAWGVTSYEGLRDELRRAVADASVTSIVLMIDSPGGYVTGVDAAADAIVRERKVKPVVALVEGMAASAAYWLASQCDAIVASPLSSLGSIGALQVHVDVSRAMDAAGVKVTVLRAGARKAEGSPYEPLSAGARASMEASLQHIRQAFAAAVAQGRDKPQLDVAAVLATEARMFNARQAVDFGQADRIGTLDQVLDGGRAPACHAVAFVVARRSGRQARRSRDDAHVTTRNDRDTRERPDGRQHHGDDDRRAEGRLQVRRDGRQGPGGRRQEGRLARSLGERIRVDEDG